MKAYESFSDWKNDQSEKNQELINRLQALIGEVAPHLTTTVKWGQGSWTDASTPKIYIHTEDDYIQLGFYNGSTLEDPDGLLSGNGKYIRFIKIQAIEDIDTEKFSYLIRQAVDGDA